MNPLRVLLAALVGGIVVFAWGAITHTLLPIGQVKPLPSDQVIVPVLKTAISEPGFYFFPALSEDAGEAEEKAWVEKVRAGPRGIVIYQPTGAEPMSARQLGTEFASNVLAAVIAAVVLALAGGSLGRRIGLGLGLGLFAWLSVDVSYWNWDGFPFDMLLGALVDQGVGWLAAGAVMGLVLGRSKAPAA